MAQPKSPQHLPFSFFPPPNNPRSAHSKADPPTLQRPSGWATSWDQPPCQEMLPERPQDQALAQLWKRGPESKRHTGAEETRKRLSQSPCLWRCRGQDYISYNSLRTRFWKLWKVIWNLPELLAGRLQKRKETNRFSKWIATGSQSARFKISGFQNETFEYELNLWQQCLLGVLDTLGPHVVILKLNLLTTTCFKY